MTGPAIIEEPKPTACPTCLGWGEEVRNAIGRPKLVTCQRCRGTGKVTVQTPERGWVVDKEMDAALYN